jgi:hypothetical protein
LKWLLWPGYAFLTADDERLERLAPRELARVWLSAMVLALLWGIASMHLWQLAQDVFYKVRFRTRLENEPWLGVAAVVTVGGLWLHRGGLGALAKALGGRAPEGRSAASAVVVVLWVLTLLSLERRGDEYRDYPYFLEACWQWLYPYPWYRALILAPLWGCWAMLMTAQLCRRTPPGHTAAVAAARGCGALKAALLLAAPLAGTLVYFHYLGMCSAGGMSLPVSLMIAGVTVVASLLAGMLWCRLGGGLKRDHLLGVNLLGQIMFLLAYVAWR